MNITILPAQTLTVPEIYQLSNILTWIGFTSAPEYIAIITDAFTMYDGLLSLKEKDIAELNEVFSRCTTNKKVNFGVRHTKKLKWLVH